MTFEYWRWAVVSESVAGDREVAAAELRAYVGEAVRRAIRNSGTVTSIRDLE